MIIGTLINSIVLMAILMGLGYFLRNREILNDDAENALVYLLVNITTPAMIINAFYVKISLDEIKIASILLVISMSFCVVLVILGNIVSLKDTDEEKIKVIKYSIVLLNGGFMGFPLVSQMYGDKGMFYAVTFHFSNMIFMWTYGTSLLIGKKKDSSRYKQMLINPGMVGMYIGLFVFISQIQLPLFAKNLLDLLTNVTTVISMVIIGSKIKTIGIKESFVDKEVYKITFWRLIFSPILMIIILKFLNFEPMIEQIYVIYAALPVAVLMPILMKKYGGDDVFSSKVVVITHLLSLITIPIFVWLYTVI